MSNHSDCSHETSFHRLLQSLLNETVRVALQGDTSANGKLVDVDPHFITVAVHRTHGTAGPSHVIVVFIPIRRIAAIAEL